MCQAGDRELRAGEDQVRGGLGQIRSPGQRPKVKCPFLHELGGGPHPGLGGKY